MADAHKNFAISLVATAPSPASSGTSLVVTAGTGTKFPAVPFNATIWPAGTAPLTTNAEIVTVTAVSTDTFTITRTQESTSARTVLVGDQIAATITAKTLTDVETGPYARIVLVDNADPTVSSGAATANNTAATTSWQNGQGLRLTTNAANPGIGQTIMSQGIGDSGVFTNIWSRKFTVVILASIRALGNSQYFLGSGSFGSSIPNGTTSKFAGFRMDYSSGTETWYAAWGDGTTDSKTNITSAVTATTDYNIGGVSQVQQMCIVYAPTSIKYYYNRTLVATSTTNLPSGAISNANFMLQHLVTNNAATSNFLSVIEHTLHIDMF